MNNAIKDADGKIIGFRCWRCRRIFDAMWGVICNACRDKDGAMANTVLKLARMMRRQTQQPLTVTDVVISRDNRLLPDAALANGTLKGETMNDELVRKIQQVRRMTE